jgi:hypothetical protein
LKVNDENSRIRIQDPDSDPLVRGMDPVDPDPDPDPPQNVMDPQHWFSRGIFASKIIVEKCLKS